MTPTAATESYPRAATYVLAGHGWGHGRGLSQIGAQGAALQGLTAAQILDFYYPGTTPTALAPADIRVLLSGDLGLSGAPSASLDVAAATGLTATDLATGQVETLPAGPARWRVVPRGGGLVVQALGADGGWTDYQLGSGSVAAPTPPASPTTPLTGPVRLSANDLLRRYVSGGSRDYRGALQAVTTGSGGFAAVAVLSLEDYLRGVLPREMPSSYPPAALQAQAVAARSYAANARVTGTRSAWDICDSTRCQVFGGSRSAPSGGASTDLEPASTTAAVTATAGLVRAYGGTPIFAQFSASNGGWTVAGSAPYLIAQADPYDGVATSTIHSWTATLTPADLERAFPALGTLQRLRVTARDGNGDYGGRVVTVVLEGVNAAGAPTSVRTSGEALRAAKAWPAAADGLRSGWFTVTELRGAQVPPATSIRLPDRPRLPPLAPRPAYSRQP